MKLRSFLIALLVLLMAFAFVSCNNEPEKQKEEQVEPAQTYRLTATKNRYENWYGQDKFTFMLYNVPGFAVKAGDVLSFSFRSNRDIPEFSLRQKSNPEGYVCWIYEDSSDAFTTFEVGEDGWTTATYEFGSTVFIKDNDVPREEWETMNVNYGKNGLGDVRLDFRGVFFAGDVLDIKDLCLNGKPIAVTEAVVADFVMPTLEVNPTTDLPAKTPSVGYVVGSTSNSNVPAFEQVALNSTINPNLSKEGHTYELYTSASVQNETTLFNLDTPITNDIILYIKWIPNKQNVTYVYNNGNDNGTDTVDWGTALEAPVSPTIDGGDIFAGWYTDDKLTERYDFDTLVKTDLILYAKYAAPRTVQFVTNCDAVVPNQTVASGNPAELPTITKGVSIFAGWFLEDTFDNEYKEGTAIETDTVLYAKWVDAVNVTLNLGVAGFTADPVVAGLGEAMDEPVAPVIPGFFFKGWFDDAEYKTAHDFTQKVTEEFPLYAKYEEGTIYHMASTHDNAESTYDYDKFTIQFQGEGQPTVNTGDVLSFRYRSTTEFTFMSIRGDKKWVYENSSSTHGMTTYETKADGWTYVTYKFAEKNTDGGTNGKDLWWRFDFGSRTIVKGDILEVQGMALNGTPLDVSKADLSKYNAPTLDIVDKAYAWDKDATNLTVTYVTGDASAIEPSTVKFGATVSPEDPTKDGFKLQGWYYDANFTKPFVFPHVIVRNETVYAKLTAQRTVTFNSNDGSAVNPAIVASGNPVARPDNPSREGFYFDYWYLTDPAEEYKFDTPVTGDITLNAKWTAKWTVTFDSKGGSDVAAKNVRDGAKVSKPDAPTKTDVSFFGWYKDEAYENKYDFDSAVNESFTLYAKWGVASKLTLDYNFTGAPTATIIDAIPDMDEPKCFVGNPGYYFGGWYTDKEGGTKIDFSKVEFSVDTTVYAHWDAPSKNYAYTATSDGDRWQFRWKSSSVSSLANLQPGDTITFMVKFGTAGGGTAPTSCRIRTANDSSEKSLGLTGISLSPDTGGWCYVSATIPAGTTISGKGILLTIDGTIKTGDTCDIRAVAYNGAEIPFDESSTSKGLYPGVNATHVFTNL